MSTQYQALANQVLDECDSTNDILKELGNAGFPHGTWVSARIQKKGRGRWGKNWESPEGNLFLSLLVRPSLFFNDLNWLPLAVSVGAVRCLRHLFIGYDFRIKWPNDLFLNGKKIGGVLCEGFGQANEVFIIVGIGINCMITPNIIGRQALSLKDGVGCRILPDNIRMPILQQILDELNGLFREGSLSIKQAYENWAELTQGTFIRWIDKKKSDHLWMEGKVQKIGLSGDLRVELPNGLVVSLFSEEVSKLSEWTSESH